MIPNSGANMRARRPASLQKTNVDEAPAPFITSDQMPVFGFAFASAARSRTGTKK